MSIERQYQWLDIIRFYDAPLAESISGHLALCIGRETRIPRKYKELMLVACSAAIRSGGSVRSHSRAALRCGAEPGQVLEAIALAALPSGYSAFIEAIEAIGDLLTEAASPQAVQE